MVKSSSPFKSYDIRGLVGVEIDLAFAQKLACALVEVFAPKTVVVGFDMRESSPTFADGMVRVLRAKGIHCIDIGICTTTVFYSSLHQKREADLGIMITASHNPSQYNGFKLCRKDAVPIGFGSGMEEVREAYMNNEHEYDSFMRSLSSDAVPLVGGYQKEEAILETYLRTVVDRLPDRGASLEAEPPRSLRIVIDAGNGMAGLSLPPLCDRIPALEVIPLYWELDGTFPNHEANPLHAQTLETLQARVVQEGAVAGFAFDGDGDRIGVVDETGAIIPGDMLTALLAEEVLRAHPGSRMLYDLRCSRSVPEVITAAGGIPELCRVGHAHIKKQMRDSNAVFAGEFSMHFYFADFGYCEASEYALLLFLEMLLRRGKPLSSLWRPLQRYAHSGEKNYTVEEPVEQIFTRIQERYEAKASSVSRIDGLRYEFYDPAHPEEDWWFSVRASNTEPLVRLNVEARYKEKMEMRRDEVAYAIIGANGAAPSTIHLG